MSWTTDPRGNVTTSKYDNNGRKTEDDHHDGGVSAALNAASQTVYDNLGRVTDEKVGTAFSGTTVSTWLTTRHTTYIRTSKVQTVTDADGKVTHSQYDGDDRLFAVTDPVSRVVYYLYCVKGNADCAANQVKTELRAWTSGSGCSVSGTLQQCYRRVAYAPDGETKTVTDANGNTTGYAYDDFVRLTKSTFPDTSFEQLGLDENGNITSRLNRAGQTLTYQYNDLNWMTQKVSPSPAATTSWTYALDGQVAGVTDGTSTINTNYDTAGRPNWTETFLPGFGGHRIMTYVLDKNGNRTKLAWPTTDGGDYVGYCYDSLNRMIAAMDNSTTCTTDVLATYSYDPQSRRTNLTYGNGAQVNTPSATAYSAAGDLLNLTHDLTGTTNDNIFSYTYTDAHQTNSAAASNSAWFWQPPSNNSTGYTVNGLNQYKTVGSQLTGGTDCMGHAQGLSYDCNGNLTFDGTTTYAYDAENRLLTASHTGLAATYVYDPLGRRVKKSGTGVTTTYFLDDGTDEVAEYDNSKTLVRRIVPGPAIDEPIALIDEPSNTKTYFHTDKQGSVIAMTDASGNLEEGPYTYDPYGTCFVSGSTPCGTGGEPYRYTGQRFDPETGLYYYRARYYDPKTGRFNQTDPVGYDADFNLYTYGGNEPVDKSDPLGQYSTNCTTPDKVCNDAATEFENQRQADLASDKDDVQASAAAFGAPDPNDKTIKVIFQPDTESAHQGGPVEGGGTVPGYYPDSHDPYVQVTVPESNTGEDLQQTIAHEGSHIQDDLKFLRSYDQKTNKYDRDANFTIRSSEQRAYTTSAKIKAYSGFQRNNWNSLNNYINRVVPHPDTLEFSTDRFPQ